MTAPRLVRLLLACALLALTMLLTPSPAWAHATLVGSSPRQDEQLDVLPDEVVFEFSADMAAPAYVIVTAPDGSSLTSGEPVVEGTTVSQAIGDGPDGAYTMAFRAVSEDGHPVTGQVTFHVGDADASVPAASDVGSSDAPDADGDAASSVRSADPAHDAGDGFMRRNGLAIAVGAGLMVLAGLLYALSRRAPSRRHPARTTRV